MIWEAAPTGRRGRQPDYSDAAIQTCLTMKVLFGMALRQTTGFVESLLHLIDLDWSVPNFSTLSRRQKGLKVNIPYRGSQGPLHLLIPSRALLRNTLPGNGQHRDQGRGRRRVERPQAWRHEAACLAQDPHPLPGRRLRSNLPRGGIDEQTLEIRAAEFTTSDVGPSHGLQANHCRATDAPMLPELLDQIPPEQQIASVTAPSHGLQANHCRATDGAFDTRKCHEAIAARSAAAIIPPRKNAKPWKPDTAGAIARNEALRASKRFGRTIWRRWSGYNRRSRVETKMHCVKLLGQRLAARDFDRQVAEFQVRVAVLNGFTALGIPITETVG